MRCYVNLEGFKWTKTGKRKVWQTDNMPVHCCSWESSLFVWERNTKYNNYDGYGGYIDPKFVELIK